MTKITHLVRQFIFIRSQQTKALQLHFCCSTIIQVLDSCFLKWYHDSRVSTYTWISSERFSNVWLKVRFVTPPWTIFTSFSRELLRHHSKFFHLLLISIFQIKGLAGRFGINVSHFWGGGFNNSTEDQLSSIKEPFPFHFNLISVF